MEGLDGCGKTTQLKLAESYLKKSGADCRTISFPEYGSISGQIVSEYLSGNIPCEGNSGAYAASSFYAIDRYISFVTDWKRDYERGAIILSARYTTSNAIYQMTKAENRSEFMEWLSDYEYVKLGLPKPDLVLFLDMPTEISQKLLSKRYDGDENRKDIHERNISFLKACRESALYAAQQYGWRTIPCSFDGEPLSVSAIHNEIAKEIEEVIRHG